MKLYICTWIVSFLRQSRHFHRFWGFISASIPRPEIVRYQEVNEIKPSHILELEGEMMAPNIVWITHLQMFIVLKQNESVTSSKYPRSVCSNVQYSGLMHVHTECCNVGSNEKISFTYAQKITCPVRQKYLYYSHFKIDWSVWRFTKFHSDPITRNIKIFRLICKWPTKENPRSGMSMRQQKMSGNPLTNFKFLLAFGAPRLSSTQKLKIKS